MRRCAALRHASERARARGSRASVGAAGAWGAVLDGRVPRLGLPCRPVDRRSLRPADQVSCAAARRRALRGAPERDLDPTPAEGGPAPCGACDDARRRGRARQASARAPPLSNCCAAASHVARCTVCAGWPYGLACGQAVPAGGGAGDLPAHEVQLGPPRASPRRRCLRVRALQRERAHTRMRARALARTHAWSAHTRARTHTHTRAHARAFARICTHLYTRTCAYICACACDRAGT